MAVNATAKPILRTRQKSAWRTALDLYRDHATFRGFTDCAVIGTLALLFLGGMPSLPGASSSVSVGFRELPASSAVPNNPGLAAMAMPPDFGRNGMLAPRLSELGLREERFSNVSEPLHARLVAAWQAYRSHDPERAVDLLRGAPADDPNVLFIQGMARIAETEDGAFSSGIALLEQAVAKGDVKAIAVMGVLKIAGMPGLPRDLAAGQKLLLQAASSGDVDAARTVGEGYLSGWMGSVDFALAASQFKIGAAKGDAKSAFRLADLYYQGRGVKQDEAEADRLLEIAARGGYRKAESLLGFRRLTPYLAGATDDPSAALQWLERAAEQHEAYGMLILSTFYTDYGKRIGRLDIARGMDLLDLCVQLTANADCARNYAAALDKGDAGPRDPVKIYALYSVSNRPRVVDATATRLDELTKQLSPDQIDKALELARVIVAKAEDRRLDE